MLLEQTDIEEAPINNEELMDISKFNKSHEGSRIDNGVKIVGINLLPLLKKNQESKTSMDFAAKDMPM